MVFKFVFVYTLVVAASAGYAPASYDYLSIPVAVHAATVAGAHKVIVKTEDYAHHPQYKYSYGVEDKLTGDSKNQIEESDGGVVRGEYSLIDADGYKRTVKYTADDHNGFNAVVERKPLAKQIIPYIVPTIDKTVAPVAPVAHYAAPTIKKTVATVVHYPAPVKYTSYDVPTYYNYHQY